MAPASKANTTPKTQIALEMAPELKDFIEQELDFVTFKRYNDKYIIYLSDDDPYIHLETSKKYFKENIQHTEIKEFIQHGHFNEKAGIIKLPEILKEINTIF